MFFKKKTCLRQHLTEIVSLYNSVKIRAVETRITVIILIFS